MSKTARVGICSSLAVCLATAAAAVWFVAAGQKQTGSSPAVVGAVAEAGNRGKTAASPDGSASPAGVETVPVTREDLRRITEPGPAELLPLEQTDLYAKATGFVKEIRVDLGDRVRKNDVLAELSIPEMLAELDEKKQLIEQAKATVLQAQATVESAQADVEAAAAGVGVAQAAMLRADAELEFRQKEHKRLRGLAEQKAVPWEVVDEKLYQVQSADAARKEVTAKVQLAKANLSVSQAQLSKTRADHTRAESGIGVAEADANRVAALLEYATVRAPYDGVITHRNVHTGAYLDARAAGPPLFRIVRTDVLRVVLDIPEKDAPYLNLGEPVHVEIDALPGLRFTWPIARFAPVLGAGRKVRAEVHIKNQDGKLYPGMYGRASVVLEDKPHALTLPAACVGNDASGLFVYCVVDGKAERQRVTVGLNDGKKVEITSGLTGKEEVILGGRGLIREGQPVVGRRAAP